MKISDMQEGTRVRLVEVVELYPIGIFPVGLTGTVVATELHCPDRPSVEVKLDEYHDCLDEWDNCLFVYQSGPDENGCEDACTAAHWEPVPAPSGIFGHHRCWKCDNGRKPCVEGAPTRCGYPRALND